MDLKNFFTSICISVIIYTSASLASQPDALSSAGRETPPGNCVGTCYIFDYDAKTLLQTVQIKSKSLDGLNQVCVLDAGEDIHPWAVRETSCN